MEAIRLWEGDCLDALPTLKACSIDAVVTDPPYGLEFMGKNWDHGIPGVTYWQAIKRVLRPGGYMLAFGGTRTWHRLTCAIEDAGFEIRDTLMWLYGSGFPKSKGCLKPAWEPIILARRMGPSVLPLGVDECRIGTSKEGSPNRFVGQVFCRGRTYAQDEWSLTKIISDPIDNDVGRWPANLILDEEAGELLDEMSGKLKSGKAITSGHKRNQPSGQGIYGSGKGLWDEAGDAGHLYGDTGGASRFFYCAKASKADRGKGNTHPTVKPLALMR